MSLLFTYERSATYKVTQTLHLSTWNGRSLAYTWCKTQLTVHITGMTRLYWLELENATHSNKAAILLCTRLTIDTFY